MQNLHKTLRYFSAIEAITKSVSIGVHNLYGWLSPIVYLCSRQYHDFSSQSMRQAKRRYCSFSGTIKSTLLAHNVTAVDRRRRGRGSLFVLHQASTSPFHVVQTVSPRFISIVRKEYKPQKILPPKKSSLRGGVLQYPMYPFHSYIMQTNAGGGVQSELRDGPRVRGGPGWSERRGLQRTITTTDRRR